jgi:hypothetical protein
MNTPRKTIPPERQMAYYLGLGMMVIGFLLFFSVFITSCQHFGDQSPHDFGRFASNAKSSMFRALAGMGLIIAGGIVRGIGARGLAGSGVVLDPEQARKDIEPWNRMAGGMAGDALSEVPLVQKLERKLDEKPAAPAERVKVRCQKCRALNDEDAKFCKQCGAAL